MLIIIPSGILLKVPSGMLVVVPSGMLLIFPSRFLHCLYSWDIHQSLFVYFGHLVDIVGSTHPCFTQPLKLCHVERCEEVWIIWRGVYFHLPYHMQFHSNSFLIISFHLNHSSHLHSLHTCSLSFGAHSQYIWCSLTWSSQNYRFTIVHKAHFMWHVLPQWLMDSSFIYFNIALLHLVVFTKPSIEWWFVG